MKKAKLFKTALILMAVTAVNFTACKKNEPAEPTPKNFIKVDNDVPKPIEFAAIGTIQLSGDNNYDIILMPQQPIDGPSWEQSVFIHFNLSGNKHDGKIVDLTKKEDNPEGWYWYVKYYLENPKLDLVGKGEIDEFRPLGKGSTLYIKRLKKDSYDYEISFTLKFLDGVEGTKITHIVRGNYTGKLKSKVDDKGNPLEDGDIWIDNLKEYK